jgi:cell division protein ZapA
MDKTIRVRVLGRDYALRVREEDEGFTRTVAAYVDDKMKTFRQRHPEPPELTTAVVVALALAEEMMTAKEEQRRADAHRAQVLDQLARQLGEAMAHEDPPPAAPPGAPRAAPA